MTKTKRLISVFMIAGFCLSGVFAFAGNASAAAAKSQTVRFGAPPWPGVTIKTGIASKILQTLGYRTVTKQLDVPIILNGIAHGQIDVYLGGWTPVEDPMIKPLLKKGQAVELAPNISDAIEGLAVPTYVWKAGVHDVADLNAHAAKFDHKIYGIEAGSGINNAVEKAIKENKAHLGNWNLVQSSTSGMLVQVKRAVRRHDWLVFVGWRPHWMNIKFHMKYLSDKHHTGTANLNSIVYTVVPTDYTKTHPNVARFLKQFRIPAKVQSGWIYEFSYKKEKKKVVVERWLKQHPKLLANWLDGVTTASGEPGLKAVKDAIANGNL